MDNLQIIKSEISEIPEWVFLEMIDQAPNHGQIMLANFLLQIYREKSIKLKEPETFF